jgi:uncharacterized protein YqhQ
MLNYYYGVLLIGLAIFIVVRGVLACMFNHIAELKGYHGITEWLLVFFLGIYGILYIWMLPIKNEEQEVAEEDQLIEGQV